MNIGILATGAYVPPTVVDNAAVAGPAGTTPEWIEERTGIRTRRRASADTATSDLAYLAVHELVRLHPTALEHVRALIVATSTGDQPQPATAALLQHRLGLPAVPAFDVNAVCSGWLYALHIGAALAQQPTTGPHVLIVGADKYSAILNPEDRRTTPLFGDGAGATLLGPVPDGYGLQASRLHTDGAYYDAVGVPGGGSRRPLDAARLEAGAQHFRMNGRQVVDYVLSTLPALIRDVLADVDLKLRDVARLVFHQANPRLLGQLAAALGVDMARVPLTAPEYGNLGAASLPVTLHETHRRDPLARGDVIVLAAVGGGLTAGAAVLTWY